MPDVRNEGLVNLEEFVVKKLIQENADKDLLRCYADIYKNINMHKETIVKQSEVELKEKIFAAEDSRAKRSLSQKDKELELKEIEIALEQDRIANEVLIADRRSKRQMRGEIGGKLIDFGKGIAEGGFCIAYLLMAMAAMNNQDNPIILKTWQMLKPKLFR